MSDHILHCAQCGAAIGSLGDGAPDKCPECGGAPEIEVGPPSAPLVNFLPLPRIFELKIQTAWEIHQVACESAPCGNSIELFKLSQEALNSAYDMAYALSPRPLASLCKCSCGDDDEHDFEDGDEPLKSGKTLLG
jgi:hypothetical protein